MQKLFLLSFIFLTSISLQAQTVTVKDTSWKKGGFFAINLSQTQYNNWAGGGENSLEINGMFNAFYNYKVKMYTVNTCVIINIICCIIINNLL